MFPEFTDIWHQEKNSIFLYKFFSSFTIFASDLKFKFCKKWSKLWTVSPDSIQTHILLLATKESEFQYVHHFPGNWPWIVHGDNAERKTRLWCHCEWISQKRKWLQRLSPPKNTLAWTALRGLLIKWNKNNTWFSKYYKFLMTEKIDR